MRPLTRRGVTLVELLIGLSLLGMLAGVATAIVQGAGRAGAHAVIDVGLARLTSSTAALLRQDLRDADSSDIRLSGGTRLLVARPVGDALVCGVTGSAVLVDSADWSGARLPAAGSDVALVLTDPLTESWDTVSIVSVGARHCPATGAAALELALAVPVAEAVALRVMEPAALSIYRSGSSDWFGLAPGDGSSAVQPFAGPLRSGASHFNLFGAELHAFIALSPSSDTTVVIPLGWLP